MIWLEPELAAPNVEGVEAHGGPLLLPLEGNVGLLVQAALLVDSHFLVGLGAFDSMLYICWNDHLFCSFYR